MATKVLLLLIGALAATVDARVLLAPAATKALALRGGSSVSLIAASPAAVATKSKKASVVIGVNAFVSTAYGVLATVKPNAMLAIFGVTEALPFMSPAFGVAQYLGGLHLAVALRCFGALGAPLLPAREPKAVLQDMCALHTIAGLVAGYRQLKGSSSPVVGSVIMAGLAYWAQKD